MSGFCKKNERKHNRKASAAYVAFPNPYPILFFTLHASVPVWYNRYKLEEVMLQMKKTAFLLATVAVMLVVSRFIVRIVDATVQIDDDIGLLLLLLVIVNAVIGFVGYKLYLASKNR